MKVKRNITTRKRKTRRVLGGNGNSLKNHTPIKFAVMAMFKNEEMVLKEWIKHYLWQGADLIILLDNGSTDDYRSITDQFKDKVHVLYAPKRHAQGEQYNKIGMPFLKGHKVDVVAILDIDEYMFGTDGKKLKKHVIDIFGKSDRPSQFSCHWNMFGSSGHEKHPESIRKSFTWRQAGTNTNIKSVVWLNDILPGGLNQHQSKVSGKTIGCPEGIQLNHYAIMSKEYFEKVKMTRGNVSTPGSNKIRNLGYFKGYNHKNHEDTQLKDLVVK